MASHFAGLMDKLKTDKKEEKKEERFTTDLEPNIQERLNIIAKGGISSTQPSLISIDAIK